MERVKAMWWKEYRDYPKDKPLIAEPVESGRGIIGCEMHDLNGWGTDLHRSRPRKRGFLSKMIARIFQEI